MGQTQRPSSGSRAVAASNISQAHKGHHGTHRGGHCADGEGHVEEARLHVARRVHGAEELQRHVAIGLQHLRPLQHVPGERDGVALADWIDICGRDAEVEGAAGVAADEAEGEGLAAVQILAEGDGDGVAGHPALRGMDKRLVSC
jgi:hypothetical protein